MRVTHWTSTGADRRFDSCYDGYRISLPVDVVASSNVSSLYRQLGNYLGNNNVPIAVIRTFWSLCPWIVTAFHPDGSVTANLHLVLRSEAAMSVTISLRVY